MNNIINVVLVINIITIVNINIIARIMIIFIYQYKQQTNNRTDNQQIDYIQFIHLIIDSNKKTPILRAAADEFYSFFVALCTLFNYLNSKLQY